MPSFEMQSIVAAAPEDVFDFLIRPENIIRVTDPESGLKPVAAPAVFERGSRIELELTGLGPVQKFLYEVTEFDRPNRFTEVLVKGPLKAFRHEHLFEPVEGGTRVIDQITFEPPGGMLGFLVTADRIRSGLESGFRYRHAELAKIFGTV